MGAGDVESAAGMVKVRLNGNYVQWPAWGRTVLAVAQAMSNTKCFTSRGDKGKQICFSVRASLPVLGVAQQTPHRRRAAASQCRFEGMIRGEKSTGAAGCRWPCSV